MAWIIAIGAAALVLTVLFIVVFHVNKDQPFEDD